MLLDHSGGAPSADIRGTEVLVRNTHDEIIHCPLFKYLIRLLVKKICRLTRRKMCILSTFYRNIVRDMLKKEYGNLPFYTIPNIFLHALLLMAN